MTTDSQLSMTESKKQKQKLSKQLEQEQNHRNGDHLEGYQQGSRGGRIREKLQGIRSLIGRYKIDGEELRVVQEIRRMIGRHKIDGDIKNSIGNGEAKELICTTHGLN